VTPKNKSLWRYKILTLDITSNDHDQPAMVIRMVSVMDSSSDFASPDHFFQGHQHEFHRQKRHTFVEQVKRAEENQVPEKRER